MICSLLNMKNGLRNTGSKHLICIIKNPGHGFSKRISELRTNKLCSVLCTDTDYFNYVYV